MLGHHHLQDLIDPDDSLFDELEALAWRTEDPPLLPVDLARQWLATLSLDQYTTKKQNNLITAMLATFPSLDSLTLLKPTLNGPSLVELLSKSRTLRRLRIDAASNLSKNGVMGILHTFRQLDFTLSGSVVCRVMCKKPGHTSLRR